MGIVNTVLSGSQILNVLHQPTNQVWASYEGASFGGTALFFTSNYQITLVQETSFQMQTNPVLWEGTLASYPKILTLNYNTTFTLSSIQWFFSNPSRVYAKHLITNDIGQQNAWGLFINGPSTQNENLGTMYAVLTFADGQTSTSNVVTILANSNVPSPITVTKSIYTSGGGVVSTQEYSLNGGLWNSMPATLTIAQTDAVSYRGTFGQGNTVWHKELSINNNIVASESTWKSSVLSSPASFTSTSDYTVLFSCYPSNL